MELKNIPFDKIDFEDDSFESRSETRVKAESPQITSLVSAYESGAEIPPPEVAVSETDPKRYVIIDGRRRITALKKMGKASYELRIVAGTLTSKLFRSFERNATHGQFLTVGDRKACLERFLRYAVMEAEGEDEGETITLKFTQKELGKKFRLSQATVSELLASLKKKDEFSALSLASKAGKPNEKAEKSPLRIKAEKALTALIRAEKLISSSTVQSEIHKALDDPKMSATKKTRLLSVMERVSDIFRQYEEAELAKAEKLLTEKGGKVEKTAVKAKVQTPKQATA